MRIARYAKDINEKWESEKEHFLSRRTWARAQTGLIYSEERKCYVEIWGIFVPADLLEALRIRPFN